MREMKSEKDCSENSKQQHFQILSAGHQPPARSSSGSPSPSVEDEEAVELDSSGVSLPASCSIRFLHARQIESNSSAVTVLHSLTSQQLEGLTKHPTKCSPLWPALLETVMKNLYVPSDCACPETSFACDCTLTSSSAFSTSASSPMSTQSPSLTSSVGYDMPRQVRPVMPVMTLCLFLIRAGLAPLLTAVWQRLEIASSSKYSSSCPSTIERLTARWILYTTCLAVLTYSSEDDIPIAHRPKYARMSLLKPSNAATDVRKFRGLCPE